MYSLFHITIFSRNTKNRKNRLPPDVDGYMMYIRTYLCRYNIYVHTYVDIIYTYIPM